MSARAGRLTDRRDAGTDAGVSLIEVMVSMSVLGIVMSMFTTGVVVMYRSVTLQESVAMAQSQANIAFQRLDTEIRYAAGISVPGQTAAPGNIPYVEYETTTAAGPKCTQLRLFNETLQLRTWYTRTTSTPAANWRQLVASVTTATATTAASRGPAPFRQVGPFSFWQADPIRGYQRLRVSLAVTAGRDANRVNNQTAITFTALNTSIDTDSAAICPAPRPAA
ncbi:MAG TPA: prepilin-type N-terminal cleavage/methylation domain-containing protein [Catenuloplanes sp.]